MRVMALWFPDWPVQAALLDRDSSAAPHRPLAIAADYRIKVCDHSARRYGVRRGMKVRQAQAVCPELEVLSADVDRDNRMFEGIVESITQVAASVEILRAGLVVVEAGAVARYHGSEDVAANMLIDAASHRGIDVVVGVADEIITAVIATRAGSGVVVEQGASISFLAAQPLGVLLAEEALECAVDVISALSDLGITTLGEFVDIPVAAVATRFGSSGLHCHSIAHARHGRHPAMWEVATQWEVSHRPEAAIMRVDTAAFLARGLAAKLHQLLSQAGMVCQLLKVTADFSDGTTLSRTWRTTQALSEAGTADRVRWQLDGWLTVRGLTHDTEEDEFNGITALWLTPLECVPPDIASGGLWDTGASQQVVARQVIERVQSTLGVDAVLQPVPVGGRGVAERIMLVPFGEQRDPVRNPEGGWVGRIPGPLPARLGGGINHPAAQVVLISAAGDRVEVTAEALLSHTPYALSWGKKHYVISAWAGPWPVDDRWWTPQGEKYARLQVVGQAVDSVEQLSAWLLVWLNRRWRIEATY